MGRTLGTASHNKFETPEIPQPKRYPEPKPKPEPQGLVNPEGEFRCHYCEIPVTYATGCSVKQKNGSYRIVCKDHIMGGTLSFPYITINAARRRRSKVT